MCEFLALKIVRHGLAGVAWPKGNWARFKRKYFTSFGNPFMFRLTIKKFKFGVLS